MLAATIRRVLAGDFSAPEWITPAGSNAFEPDDDSPLTPRQLEILSLLHLPNKEIGLRLRLAEVTVKMHRRRAMEKLGARSVARLARIAEVLDIQA